jgi:hypothetical protein
VIRGRYERMGYFRKERRVMSSDDEIKGMTITVSREMNMLGKVRIVKNGKKGLSVRVREVVNVDIEIPSNEKVVRCSGNSRDQGLKIR